VQNNISDNTIYGIYIPSECKANSIRYNDFMDNGNQFTNQVYDANNQRGQENNWNTTTNTTLAIDGSGEGNYWDDYEGEDQDEDGVGDTAYTFTSGRVQREDSYPLMRPYDWCVVC
jgi:nitrous oxidase accessory protein NosD